MSQDYKDSDLERWLRKRNMKTIRFAELVGCSRPIIWKVKRGIAICPFYAKRIFDLTSGEVTPFYECVGRPKQL
jgi:hypothetical protein